MRGFLFFYAWVAWKTSNPFGRDILVNELDFTEVICYLRSVKERTRY